MNRKGESLHRRASKLEEQREECMGEDAVIEIHFAQPVAKAAGGGKKVRVEALPAGTGVPDRYYFTPPGAKEEADGEGLTREEFDALPLARHTLPEGHPDYQPRQHAR